MITFEEIVHVDEAGKATVTLPATVKPGAHRIVMHVDESPLSTVVTAPKAGCLPGFWMADDFDAPLEDFREYME